MENPLYPWQAAAWGRLQRLHGRMPHAILFHGPEGIGKSTLAEWLAQSLLCPNRTPEGHACGQCESCGWFAQYSHPDYRRVRPEIMDEAQGQDDEGSDSGDGKKTSKSSKAPSKEIKIDQIRALADFMNVSTHRQGMRIIVLYPAEALNTAAANALLKVLEEPPPGTVFLLASNSLDRLLPTIVSRCRKFALSMPSAEEGVAWLKAQEVANAEALLAEQGGAPLAALTAAQGEGRTVMEEFLRQLARPSVDGALKAGEQLQKIPATEAVAWLQRWLYDVFSLKLSGRIRYYPRYQKELAALAARAEMDKLLDGLKAAGERRAIAEHPLSARLFMEDMLLDYSKIFSA
ncbi:DNA polymerase III subunit delta' [Noviherbaspirillum massiliense]|uniref:DNA polymerase III subunit delta' n=1 Tax=Noviherbaspirillum massiliense TaxID=1465823 RepID=UPI0002DCE70B|nr:DNA polymerase III subunit delta' [Noviherbaspirillum massiliense]